MAMLTYRGTVFSWQCDHMGHMNVMYYVGKFDEATWSLLSAIGMTRSYLRETNSGAAAVQQAVTYKRELFPGDIVEIRSSIISIGERKLIFRHEMRNVESDEICAICELTGVHIDRNTRRAVPFPADIRKRAEELIGKLRGFPSACERKIVEQDNGGG